MKIRPRRIVAALGVIVLVLGCYVGWLRYKGQQMSNQVDAQKLTQGFTTRPGSASSHTQDSDQQSSTVSPNQTPPSADSISQDPSNPGAGANSIAPVSSSDTPSSKNYKQLMSKTYLQTLQTMENIKSNTLALQNRKMSLPSYKASILQSQKTFSAAEAYVRKNPPTDANLNISYQEFLEGISLAKQAMTVVLNGISSFKVSELYSAREMGITAQQQVVNAYSHL